MRCFVMFVTAVCVLFLLKLKRPKIKEFLTNDRYYSCLFVRPDEVLYKEIKGIKFPVPVNDSKFKTYRTRDKLL